MTPITLPAWLTISELAAERPTVPANSKGQTFTFRLAGRSYVATYARATPTGGIRFAEGGVGGILVELLVDIAQPWIPASNDGDVHYQAAVIRLREGSATAVVDWASALQTRHAEAIESIRAEGVFAESWFRTELAGQPHLFAVMVCQTSEAVSRDEPSSELEVDRIHREFKRYWDRGRMVRCDLFS